MYNSPSEQFVLSFFFFFPEEIIISFISKVGSGMWVTMPGTVPASRQHCTIQQKKHMMSQTEKYCPCFILTQGGARERRISAG